MAEGMQKRTPQVLFTLCLFMILIPAVLSAQAGRKKLQEGNTLFYEEKYDEANNMYQDALLDNPTSPSIQYNIGNVLYKKNNYEKALEAYQKSLDIDDAISQSKAYYNIGNSLYRAGKLPESILAYEQALKLNPEDEDAKYNLEFVRNKMKENAQPQQQDPQNQQNSQEQQQEEQNNPSEQNEKEEQESESGAEEQGEQKEMSKEEAERLLEALKENQEDMKKKRAKAQGKARVKKDW
jgi:tetratricopeptide (TPR) repeat protein